MFPRGNFNKGGEIRTHMEQNVPCARTSVNLIDLCQSLFWIARMLLNLISDSLDLSK